MAEEVVQQKRPRGRPRKIQPTPETIEKANSEGLSVSRLRLGEIGSTALQVIKDEAERAKVRELKWPLAIHTYETMRNDATIATALTLKQQMLEKAFNKWVIDYNKLSPKSKEAADFIKYNFSNLQDQTLRQISSTASDFNVYGFSCFEKVFTKINNGKYLNKYQYKLNKLAHRPQATLNYCEPFKFSEDGRDVLGIWQNPDAFQDNNGMSSFDWMKNVDPMEGAVFIDIKKVAMFNINGTESNPMGRSPLVACYKPFREKVVIENLEVVGVSKQLGGVLELKIPSMILQKAAMDPSSKEASFLKQLMKDAANAHQGEQSFFILPSDVQVGGQEQYKMSLKGVDGSSSDTNTTVLINERKKVILDAFGAGFINLGNEGVGSYALSDGKKSLHDTYIDRDIQCIEETFNENIIPQLLSLNGIYLDDEDMPKLRAGKIEEVDLNAYSSAIQRMGAVGFIPRNKEVINHILNILGVDWELTNESPDEILELVGKPTTRAGDGMSSGLGNGTGDGVVDKDSSVSNSAQLTT